MMNRTPFWLKVRDASCNFAPRTGSVLPPSPWSEIWGPAGPKLRFVGWFSRLAALSGPGVGARLVLLAVGKFGS